MATFIIELSSAGCDTGDNVDMLLAYERKGP